LPTRKTQFLIYIRDAGLKIRKKKVEINLTAISPKKHKARKPKEKETIYSL
jgi:hypothetical protein